MSREDRRSSLLDAAADLLRTPQRQELTFERVAEAAGVSPTLPYKYFESLDQLANELYDHLVGPVDDEIDQLLASTDLSFDDKIRGSLHVWTTKLRQDGRLLLRLTNDVAQSGLRVAIERRREASITHWASELETQFALDTAIARVVAASVTAGSAAVLHRWVIDRLDEEPTIELFVALCRAQVDAATKSNRDLRRR